jgi:FixJ family two-component response regulator
MSAVVFVVDDDPSVRAALEDLLASVGLQSVSFGSVHEFVTDVHSFDAVPACIVLDIRMPGQNGLDFQRQMAEFDIHLPVIVITGHGDMTLAVRAMKQGAVDFLPKPFRDQDLLDAVHEGIERDRVRRGRDAQLAELRVRWSSLSPGERGVIGRSRPGPTQQADCTCLTSGKSLFV